ncbi:1-(5-phosphoribosyl)-5-[(5-phosphoribosylamino) methylideneamino] imidazole-4-carboxamide isomerase [Longilinea arvoryzae]|uniref:1-(5-phosphoribosyl)-5-[(5-phosphoribosylamino) methylideneamino] imidazole-4-carboxamide isomerase n=1 Tax=Longilinea arvoryzae TaxID=360412 RepID=A0A0K8MYK6_9CHLR|nr:histidine biosynthesis protein [Longilinea arvoryzae]GAP16126.1 1-(5-phosphoribosyl)-5-[(5-phosphoribosylamino) methylideneamino] imidazole-4-carboxamide isomerase [Longilinea arvoryzae]
MIIGDMQRKCGFGLKKVMDAIEAHGGTTLLATGITGDDARLALAAVQAGARLLEPNHPAVALARGHKGVKSMHNAEAIRHEIPFEEMCKVVAGVRAVVGPEIYITVGAPGTFTETMPMPFTDEHAYALASAGADGVHCHKSTYADLKDMVDLCHKYGMLVDAYVAHPSDRHLFGIPAETPAQVAETAKKMQDLGADLIGLMTGMSYEGVAAGEIAKPVRERLEAMLKVVTVPTLAEGGINAVNFKAFRGTGVNILVVGTAFDDIARKAVADTVGVFLQR